MVVQSNNLNLIPGQISPRVNVSQYDKKSRTLTFSLYNGSQPFNITSGMAVTIEGTKPDNTGFQYAMTATIDSNVVSISIEQQMTVIAGDVPCEIVVSNAGKRLASANFILVVEPAALKETTIISETELPLIEEAAELAENIAIYVTTIHEDALKAEGYAVGKQNGVDVGSGSEYFHNNAKYYKEQAEQAAQEAVVNFDSLKETLTNEVSTRAQLGAHNIVDNKGITRTSSGVTFTKNADKSVNVSSESSLGSNAYYITTSYGNREYMTFIPKGKYILSGGADTSSKLRVYLVYESNGALASSSEITSANGELEITLTEDTYGFIQIFAKSGNSFSTEKIYPMLRKETDTNKGYQPYAMTNREITGLLATNKYVEYDITGGDTTYFDYTNAARKLYVNTFTRHCIAKFEAISVIATLPIGGASLGVVSGYKPPKTMYGVAVVKQGTTYYRGAIYKSGVGDNAGILAEESIPSGATIEGSIEWHY